VPGNLHSSESRDGGGPGTRQKGHTVRLQLPAIDQAAEAEAWCLANE